ARGGQVVRVEQSHALLEQLVRGRGGARRLHGRLRLVRLRLVAHAAVGLVAERHGFEVVGVAGEDLLGHRDRLGVALLLDVEPGERRGGLVERRIDLERPLEMDDRPVHVARAGRLRGQVEDPDGRVVAGIRGDQQVEGALSLRLVLLGARLVADLAQDVVAVLEAPLVSRHELEVAVDRRQRLGVALLLVIGLAERGERRRERRVELGRLAELVRRSRHVLGVERRDPVVERRDRLVLALERLVRRRGALRHGLRHGEGLAHRVLELRLDVLLVLLEALLGEREGVGRRGVEQDDGELPLLVARLLLVVGRGGRAGDDDLDVRERRPGLVDHRAEDAPLADRAGRPRGEEEGDGEEAGAERRGQGAGGADHGWIPFSALRAPGSVSRAGILAGPRPRRAVYPGLRAQASRAAATVWRWISTVSSILWPYPPAIETATGRPAEPQSEKTRRSRAASPSRVKARRP